ncbi:hypothetical protein [Flavobacterium chungangensis]|uniref:Uncharacterized protein n=1 Tax=Flavobacterium chungangensis TaxID=2708132 RepID=A0ABV8ZJ04_9FLAO
MDGPRRKSSDKKETLRLCAFARLNKIQLCALAPLRQNGPKRSKMKKKLTENEKKLKCKLPVMRSLRKRIKKDQKNSLKKLAEAEKGSTFAPATAKAFIEILAGKENQTERNFQKKRFEKACEI